MMLRIFLLMLGYHLPTECYSIVHPNYRLLYKLQIIANTQAHFDVHYEYIPCIFKENLLLNCSKYTNDDQIRKSFPFDVQSNPNQAISSQTYALMHGKKKIYYLNIVNQICFPLITFCLQNLEQLYIRRTSFVMFNYQLPSLIQFLSHSLEHLEISYTKMTHLSNEIGRLARLKILKLSNIDLMSLPDEIGDLSSLTFLSLSDNKLTHLPKTINKLRLLQQFVLTNNPFLRSIEPVNGLPSLRIFQTDNCPIECLPYDLSSLKDLYMSKNNLTNLTGIKTLGDKTKEKKSFYFDKNSIQSIPSEIQFVNNLFLLNLNDNQLNNLPWNIFNINTLRHFYIKNNQFNDNDLEEIVQIFKSTNSKLNLAH